MTGGLPNSLYPDNIVHLCPLDVIDNAFSMDRKVFLRDQAGTVLRYQTIEDLLILLLNIWGFLNAEVLLEGRRERWTANGRPLHVLANHNCVSCRCM